MSTGSYHLGIDLGTTYVAAGILRQGRPEIVTLGDRTPVMPSVLYFKEDGDVLHGESATRRGLSDPTRVVREFKRRVGDATPMVVGQTPYSADLLLAKLLRFAYRSVVDGQGGRPASIAVTHPANWGSYKLDVLQHAVRMAEVGPITTLTEPVAAAIHYAATERLEQGQTVAVYDLGGGTFDAAVLAKTGTGVDFEVRGDVEGIERLGGIDFDEAVFHHALRWAESAVAELDVDDPAVVQALARLRHECIAAKEALSTDTDVSIPVVLPNLQTEVRLTRAEFEAMVRPLLQQTVEALQRAIRNSGTSVDDLAAVLLVGGSSRIPLIAEIVGAELGRPIAVDQHPKHTVALGAAIAAGRASGAEVPSPAPAAVASTSPSPSASADETPSDASDSPDRSQVIAIRREGDGPQVTISRSPDRLQEGNGSAPTPAKPAQAAQHHPGSMAPVAPAAAAAATPAVVGPAPTAGPAPNALAPTPAGPGSTPPVDRTIAEPVAPLGHERPPGEPVPPFDHRDLLAGSPSGPGGRRVGAVIAVVAVVVLALAGAAALVLRAGDGADDDLEAVSPGEAEGTTTSGSTGSTGEPDADADADEAANAGPTTSAQDATTATTATTEAVESSTTAIEAGLAATIGGITIDGNAYAVDYTTTFEPVISADPASHHLHFFFDTVEVAEAGQPGAGPWILYDGPSPFRGYGPSDRPGGATRLCVTVATSEHAVNDPSVFDCVDLPD